MSTKLLIIALDASLTCTGIAAASVELSSGCAKPGSERLLGVYRTRSDLEPSKSSVWERCIDIVEQAKKAAAEMKALAKSQADKDSSTLEVHVVIETPQTFTHGLKASRSPATLPNYGMLIGAMLMGFRLWEGADKVVDISASRWTAGMSKIGQTKDDSNKTGRVFLASQRFRLNPGALGSATTAGDAADALLIAAWYADRVGTLDMNIKTASDGHRKMMRELKKRAKGAGK